MQRQVLLVGAFVAALGGHGCAMPETPVYEPNTGMGVKFCTELADHSQLVSTEEMGVGVFLLTMGGAAITASGVLSTISANSTEYRQELGYIGAGLSVAPLLAVPFGMVLLSRSDEASALAAASNTAVALSETDEDAYRDCVLAKAAWVGSRADATALARKALEEEKEKLQKEGQADAGVTLGNADDKAEEKPESKSDEDVDEPKLPGPRK